jgi:hypothetical protein
VAVILGCRAQTGQHHAVEASQESVGRLCATLGQGVRPDESRNRLTVFSQRKCSGEGGPSSQVWRRKFDGHVKEISATRKFYKYQ